MPTYTILNCDTDEISEEFFSSYNKLQDHLAGNPNLKQQLSSPKIVSGVGTNLGKTDDGWKDVLSKVKTGSGRGNTVNT